MYCDSDKENNHILHDRYYAFKCTKSKIFMGKTAGVGLPAGAGICLFATMLSSSFNAKRRICGTASPPHIYYLSVDLSELVI
jgi:hypothetical protein